MIYSDINSKDAYNIPEVIDYDSVIQSVYTLMDVRKRELLFLPQFGTASDDYVFETIDDIGASILFQDMVNNIITWEPRIELNLSSSNIIADVDNNVYKAIIVFSVIGLDGVNTISRTF